MSCLSISPDIAKTARPGAGRWLVLSLCLGLWLPVAPGALADTVPNLLPCRFPVAAPGDGSGQPGDIFVCELATGATAVVADPADGSPPASFSDDGRYTAYSSADDWLVPDDHNGVADVFVADTQTGAILRASVASDGTEADGASTAPGLAGSGGFVAFRSAASNLVAGDKNGIPDLFVHDLSTHATQRLGAGLGAPPFGQHEAWPAYSIDGRYLALRRDGLARWAATYGALSAAVLADKAARPVVAQASPAVALAAAFVDLEVTDFVLEPQPAAPARVGQLLYYTVRAFNLSDAINATNVEMNIALGDVTIVKKPAYCLNPQAGNMRCVLGTLPAFNYIDVPIDVLPTQAGTLSPSATVKADQTDPNAPSSKTASIVVQAASADLAVTLTPQVATARVGDTVRYDFTAMNSGSATANNVVLTMDLGTLANVSIPPECTQQNGQMRCVFPHLPASTTPPIASYILGRITTAGPQAVSISIKAQETDPNPANNTAAPKLAAGPASADLKLTFTASPNPAKVGDQVSFLATIINNGPSPATDVVFTLDPKTVLGLQPSAACALNGDRLECQWPRLEVGQPLAGTFVGRASVAGTLAATASIRAAEAAPVTAAAVAAGQGAAFVPGNVAITQKATAKKPKVGKKLTITLIARNKDAVQANNVVAMSILPPEVGYVAVGPGCSYAPQDRAMLCAFGSLRKGQSRQAKFKITPKQPGPFVNRVYVGGDLVDSSPGDNANSLRFVAK